VSAHAASSITNAFITDVNPNVDLLDRSSRLALDNSQNAKLRAFAKSEARQETLVANAIYDWTQADAHPVAVASNEQAGTGAILTGRSVAIDKPKVAIPEQMPSANQEDIDRLYGLTGGEFDAAYKAVQVTAIKALIVSYQEYITNSDEPALKAIATQELPKLNQRLAELDKI
jgi:predicted outer membrane protein